MKYIRTKDGIYLKDSFKDICLEASENAIAQADTIEELKDFYVVDCPQDRKMNRVFTIKQEALHYSQDCLKPQGIEHTIHGAIWTDKGLIYVAEMNEDGKLCLS